MSVNPPPERETVPQRWRPVSEIVEIVNATARAFIAVIMGVTVCVAAIFPLLIHIRTGVPMRESAVPLFAAFLMLLATTVSRFLQARDKKPPP